MMKTDNVSIAKLLMMQEELVHFLNMQTQISENTIGFKLNFATTVAVSLDAGQRW